MENLRSRLSKSKQRHKRGNSNNLVVFALGIQDERITKMERQCTLKDKRGVLRNLPQSVSLAGITQLKLGSHESAC